MDSTGHSVNAVVNFGMASVLVVIMKHYFNHTTNKHAPVHGQ